MFLFSSSQNPMTELYCPVCKADSYLNPNIKIYVSPCFHRICESCLYKLFQQGHAPCPECGILLRRINFIVSTFEDIEVERELKMRKLMNRYFKRNLSDFENEGKYNDYLEEYENLLFELLEHKTEAAVRERIDQIKNSTSILVSRMMKRNADDSPEEIKRTKTEENWCVYKREVVNPFNIDDDVTLPGDFMIPYKPAGLKKREILDFIAYSLFEIINK